MSRSGYTDDCENIAMWRGAVRSATFGKRGQKLLRELLASLDEMPVKELIAEELEADGAHCALGVVGKYRGIALADIDPDEYDRVASAFDIAPALAREVVYQNDEGGRWDETPAARWLRVRRWVESQIVPATGEQQ
jgi:hypothetical protein